MTDESPWLDDAEMAAWLAFLEVSHRLDRAIEQQLRRDAGLSHAQYEVLARLDAPRFRRLIQQNPFFATHVMKVLVDRVRRIDRVRATKS